VAVKAYGPRREPRLASARSPEYNRRLFGRSCCALCRAAASASGMSAGRRSCGPAAKRGSGSRPTSTAPGSDRGARRRRPERSASPGSSS